MARSTRASVGFAGSESDGLEQLDDSHTLTPVHPDAREGNVVATARLALDGSGKTVLALGFGATDDEAIDTAAGSRAAGFDAAFNAYKSGWNAYDATLTNPRVEKLAVSATQRKQLKDAYYLSANVIKASEDKTFPGAIVASLASPWGQAVSAGDPNNTYFGSYREVFARDLYESWTGLVAAGDLATARDATLFLFERQQLPDGSFPRNSLVNGKVAPDSFGTQLDEVAYPILMAYQLGLTDASLFEDHIKPAANYVAARGPAFGVERWEEQSGYSPSTIASEIAGLVAAAELATANGDDDSAAIWLGVADEMQRSVKEWTVTTNGPLSDEPYFIRLSKTGDPDADIDYNVGNGGPTLDQRAVIDAGFLELVRLGELPANDPDVLRTLPIVDAEIKSTTPSGPGWHRYNDDGYGDRATDGRPWAPSGQGTGHLWPVLSAERAEHELVSGNTAEATSLAARNARDRVRCRADPRAGVGAGPNRGVALWHRSDDRLDRVPARQGGRVGVTADLVGCLVRAADGRSGREAQRRAAGRHARPLRRQQPGHDAADGHGPGRRKLRDSLARDRHRHDHGGQHGLRCGNEHRRRHGDDHRLDHRGRRWLVQHGHRSHRRDERHQHRRGQPVRRHRPGAANDPVRLRAGHADPRRHRPRRRRQRPRQLRLPDVGQLPRWRLRHPAIRGLRRRYRGHLQAPDAKPERDVRQRAGAQLVDVYVHVPGAVTTSTAAANPSRNFQIAPADAWSRLIQVQGFGQRYQDASGTTLGTVTINGNPISRFITIRVPKDSLGQPASGWTFTVVLTGQDGFSPDQARGFQSTPEDFQFGVCATASQDEHCTVDPATVPKLMDVITPPGVDQSDEVDYTVHTPVVLSGVSIP